MLTFACNFSLQSSEDEEVGSVPIGKVIPGGSTGAGVTCCEHAGPYTVALFTPEYGPTAFG